MADKKNINKVKLFLQADTPEELVELQIRNNRANDRMYEYEVVVWRDKLLAWFWADLTITDSDG